jgi:N-methylhydantoinase B
MIMTIDPITLEILVQALITVVREMRATVMRTAKSVAIFEAKDFSCGLFAPDGQVVAQSEDIGSHVVPMPWSVRAAMDKFGAGLVPGDVILMNDPYAGGTHLNDVTIIYPVFDGDRLRCANTGRMSAAWCPAACPARRPKSTRKACAFRRSRYSRPAS